MLSIDTLVLASHNTKKLEEIKRLLSLSNIQSIEIKTASDFNLNDPEETEDTFHGNALLKARYVAKHTNLTALADDSGLVIPALNGEPGVHSARFAGPDRDYDAAIKKLQLRLNPALDPAAYFMTVMALVTPDDGKEYTFEGRVDGRIQFPPKGNNRFAYDPIFVPNGYTETFAEMTADEKNKISHRAKALESFINFFMSK